MEIIFAYVTLSALFIILFIAAGMSRTSKLPYLMRRLTTELGFDDLLAERIQVVCDQHRQGDPELTDIVIYQCAWQGNVTAEDVIQICEHFPGMLRDPSILRTKCHLDKITFDELLDSMRVVR